MESRSSATRPSEEVRRAIRRLLRVLVGDLLPHGDDEDDRHRGVHRFHGALNIGGGELGAGFRLNDDVERVVRADVALRQLGRRKRVVPLLGNKEKRADRLVEVVAGS
jgi:hypothetical protein